MTVPLVVVQSPGGGNNGAATYTYGVSDHAADFLAEGETLTLTYMARVDNNFALNNEFSFASFTITITGTNDVPTILVGQTTPTGVVVEDSNVNASGNITTGGTITFNDVDLTDTHTASFVFSSSHASGSLPGFADNTSIGTFALTSVGEVPADGDTSGSVGWTFAVDDSNPIVQSLAEGQTITLVYIVTVSDGHGGTVDQEVTVTVTGTSPNHAPTIVGELTTATGDVTEDVDVNGSNRSRPTVHRFQGCRPDRHPHGELCADLVDVERASAGLHRHALISAPSRWRRSARITPTRSYWFC